MKRRMTADEYRRAAGLPTKAASAGKVRATVKAKLDPKRKQSGRMNKTEAEYLRMIEARPEVVWVAYERIKLRLADNTWYTPDFAVLLDTGMMELHEVKGGTWRMYGNDGGRIKLKVAVDQYPMFRWVVAQKKKGEWRYEEMQRDFSS
jgi:hypothetical protein